MKKLILIVSVGLFFSCGTTTSETKKDSTSVKSDTLAIDSVKVDTTKK